MGRDPFLKRSMIDGDPLEGYPPSGIWIEDVAYDNDVVDAEDVHVEMTDDVGNDGSGHNQDNDGNVMDDESPLDEFHEVHRQVMEP